MVCRRIYCHKFLCYPVRCHVTFLKSSNIHIPMIQVWSQNTFQLKCLLFIIYQSLVTNVSPLFIIYQSLVTNLSPTYGEGWGVCLFQLSVSCYKPIPSGQTGGLNYAICPALPAKGNLPWVSILMSKPCHFPALQEQSKVNCPTL